MGTNAELYKQDFFEWTQITAALIRAGKWYDIAPKALAEEVESLGARDHRELRRRLQRLVTHLLKWQYQPSRCQTGHSWQSTIRTQRQEIADLLEQSPSSATWIPYITEPGNNVGSLTRMRITTSVADYSRKRGRFRGLA
jgi:Domain of unknown function DUF29